MIFAFVGLPHTGKGTQAQFLRERILLDEHEDIPVLSMGELIRNAKDSGDVQIIEAYTKYSMRGEHLPIDIKFRLLKEKMDKTDQFILDNFPATEEDLGVLIEYLQGRQLEITGVFNLVISESEILHRLTHASRGRPDDTREIVQARSIIQERDRQVVLNYFEKQGLLRDIDAKGTILEVNDRIVEGYSYFKEKR